MRPIYHDDGVISLDYNEYELRRLQIAQYEKNKLYESAYKDELTKHYLEGYYQGIVQSEDDLLDELQEEYKRGFDHALYGSLVVIFALCVWIGFLTT